MTLYTTSPGDERDRLHAAIMNIRCAPKVPADFDIRSYALGHRDARHAAAELVSSSTVQQVGAEWMPIETAPNAEQRDMFVVRAFNVSNEFTGGRNYTSDAWCVWRDIYGGFSRWPHKFAPTHWTALPSSPKSEQGDQQ